MMSRILAAFQKLEDTVFSDALGIICLSLIVPFVFLLGEVLQ